MTSESFYSFGFLDVVYASLWLILEMNTEDLAYLIVQGVEVKNYNYIAPDNAGVEAATAVIDP